MLIPGVGVQVPPRAPNQYNPNQIFLVGEGFGLFVYFERFEDTYFRNGEVKRPESRPRGPRKQNGQICLPQNNESQKGACHEIASCDATACRTLPLQQESGVMSISSICSLHHACRFKMHRAIRTQRSGLWKPRAVRSVSPHTVKRIVSVYLIEYPSSRKIEIRNNRSTYRISRFSIRRHPFKKTCL